MQIQSFILKNKKIILSLVFLVVNTLSICLIFNTPYFSVEDPIEYNTKFILIAIGVCFVLFFVCLKYLKSLSIKHLFLIFFILKIGLITFFILFNYGLEMDFAGPGMTWTEMAKRILDGNLFTDYSSNLIIDWWRIMPPLLMWWYTYNYFVYGLNPIVWRVVNFLLEIGIVYVMIKIFQENKTTEKGFNGDNFKIGLSFYIFSIFPIFAISLYANYIAFPILLGLLGFLFYFRSKTSPKYLYYSIFFFSLCALTSYYAAIWIFGILLILLFQKNFKHLIISIGEVIGLFCLVSLPLLINDALGYMQRLFWAFSPIMSEYWSTTIWVIDHEILKFFPALFAIGLCTIYIYKNYDQEISLDFFIIILSMFLIFSPKFSPWYVLWILPLISINIVYSYRKYLLTNLLFLGYLIVYCLLFAIYNLLGIVQPYNETIFLIIFRMVGQTLAQIGLIYLIYSYTNSKKLGFALLLPFILYYTIYFV